MFEKIWNMTFSAPLGCVNFQKKMPQNFVKTLIIKYSSPFWSQYSSQLPNFALKYSSRAPLKSSSKNAPKLIPNDVASQDERTTKGGIRKFQGWGCEFHQFHEPFFIRQVMRSFIRSKRRKKERWKENNYVCLMKNFFLFATSSPSPWVTFCSFDQPFYSPSLVLQKCFPLVRTALVKRILDWQLSVQCAK